MLRQTCFRILLFTILHLISTHTVIAETINIPDNYKTIQDGIDASSEADTVLVHPETYYENINFNGKNIVLGSLFITTQDTSYISKTVIDGNKNGHVIAFKSGEDSTTVLSGFTLTNGYARTGGGILCYHSGPKLEYLKICNNVVDSSLDYEADEHISYDIDAAGICVYIGEPRISNVCIFNNIGDGIVTTEGSMVAYYTTLIENSVIQGNRGTGIRGFGGGIRMKNVEICNNENGLYSVGVQYEWKMASYTEIKDLELM
ncbi:MAG: hypothetical protein JXB48_04195 [Candidatus Latescibacteria bacterium]|nr:hypothetical protein [Candidatus Latescibacterota bacterium]